MKQTNNYHLMIESNRNKPQQKKSQTLNTKNKFNHPKIPKKVKKKKTYSP